MRPQTHHLTPYAFNSCKFQTSLACLSLRARLTTESPRRVIHSCVLGRWGRTILPVVLIATPRVLEDGEDKDDDDDEEEERMMRTTIRKESRERREGEMLGDIDDDWTSLSIIKLKMSRTVYWSNMQMTLNFCIPIMSMSSHLIYKTEETLKYKQKIYIYIFYLQWSNAELQLEPMYFYGKTDNSCDNAHPPILSLK